MKERVFLIRKIRPCFFFEVIKNGKNEKRMSRCSLITFVGAFVFMYCEKLYMNKNNNIIFKLVLFLYFKTYFYKLIMMTKLRSVGSLI